MLLTLLISLLPLLTVFLILHLPFHDQRKAKLLVLGGTVRRQL